MQNKNIQIYTDGAAKGNPGRAGWGAIILLSQNSGEPKVFEIGGGVEHATNNQMELTAPIEALKYLPEFYKKAGLELDDVEIEIVADSKYVILGITEWIAGWMRNGWKNAAKKPVVNKELWEELYKLNQEFKPKWSYVKGHNGHEYNERADVIATSFASGEYIELKK